MLVEFALTPEVFDDTQQENLHDWYEQIRELGSGMFPRSNASPVVVANLGDNGWLHEAKNAVERIEDHSLKLLCRTFLSKIKDVLVRRPLLGEWPMDELAWAREAAAHHDDPIDRIVATSSACTALGREQGAIRSLGEVLGAGFWADISGVASPRMELTEQIQMLRRICLHADFVEFISPRIYGGGDDEIDFAIALAKSCFSRSAGFPIPSVEIHTGDMETTSSQLSGIAIAVRSRIRSELEPGQRVTLVLWPRKLLHRRLLAGVYVESSSGHRERSPKWGIAMDHVARRTDDPDKIDAAAWHLLRPDALGDLYRQFSLQATPSPHIVEVYR